MNIVQIFRFDIVRDRMSSVYMSIFTSLSVCSVLIPYGDSLAYDERLSSKMTAQIACTYLK